MSISFTTFKIQASAKTPPRRPHNKKNHKVIITSGFLQLAQNMEGTQAKSFEHAR